MSSTLKLTKEQEHKNSFRRKLLKEYITSHLEDPDLVRLYTNLEKYPLSQISTSKETLGKNEKKIQKWFRIGFLN